MKSKKRLLRESCLYAVIDKKVSAKLPLGNIANQLSNSGVSVIQLRDKTSSKKLVLKEALRFSKTLSKSKTIFIVNDCLEAAMLADADGLHLGQKDIPIKTARRALKSEKIIGVSCHSLSQALKAQRLGADYISIGPIFSTPVKPEYRAVGLDLIKKIKEKIHIPFFAIGGINRDNIDKVISAGAGRIAVCRAILESKDIPSSAKYFQEKLK